MMPGGICWGGGRRKKKNETTTKEKPPEAPAAVSSRGPTVQVEACGERVRVSACPFGHGTVCADPFPGYVHGRKPEICAKGCRAVLQSSLAETPRRRLIREAIEYQELYSREREVPPERAALRLKEILESIERSGTYVHTFDELRHGARVAWRNAPKCSNRRFAMELEVLDRRDARTNKDLRDGCLDALEAAIESAATTPFMCCFAPRDPETGRGPRIWSSQICRFACYALDDGSTLGDPANLEFTTYLITSGSWTPPPEDERTQFDVLPLVLQVDAPGGDVAVFEVPESYHAKVRLSHPDYAGLAKLNLCWVAVPTVCAMDLNVGGLTYPAAPFTGWFADSEILRDLTDKTRLDKIDAIADAVGLTSKASNSSLWKDTVMLETNRAILWSWQKSGMGIVDHATLMEMHYDWTNRERERRGYVTNNWKWVVTPCYPTTTDLYLGFRKELEYTLSPSYTYAPTWKTFLSDWKAHGRRRRNKKTTTKSNKPGPRRRPTMEVLMETSPSARLLFNATFWRLVGRIARGVRLARPRLSIAYATVSGNAKRTAKRLSATFASASVDAKVVDCAGLGVQTFETLMAATDVFVLVVSTFGSGAPPSSAGALFKLLGSDDEGKRAVGDKAFAVLGLGSRAYPRFCAAADAAQALLLASGGKALTTVGKMDAAGNVDVGFRRFATDLIEALLEEGRLKRCVAARLLRTVAVERANPRDFVSAVKATPAPGVKVSDHSTEGFLKLEVVANTALVGRLDDDDDDDDGDDKKEDDGSHGSDDGVVVLNDSSSDDDDSDEKMLAPLTVSLELDLSSHAYATWSPGDHLAIRPTNAASDVEAAAIGLGLFDELDVPYVVVSEDPSRISSPTPPVTTPRQVLEKIADLGARPSYYAVAALYYRLPEAARLGPSGLRLNALIEAGEGAFTEYSWDAGLTWSRVFGAFECLAGGNVDFGSFLQLTSPIAPRFYSMSSVQNGFVGSPPRATVTVSRLAYRATKDQSPRYGLCSSYCARLRPGMIVEAKVEPVASFRPPVRPTSNVLLIGAGTGIAPFRAFWQELRRRRERENLKTGEALLVVGARTKNAVLYGDEVDDAVESGTLAEPILALSREPGQPKTYVQEAVDARADQIRRLILPSAAAAEGTPPPQRRGLLLSRQSSSNLDQSKYQKHFARGLGHVYICGDSLMADAVKKALARALGKRAFKALVETGKLHEDVFGIQLKSSVIKAKLAGQESRAIDATTSAAKEIRDGRGQEARAMIDDGTTTVHSLDNRGATLLHAAAAADDAETVKFLIDRGAAANCSNDVGETPLRLAEGEGKGGTDKNKVSKCAGLLRSAGGLDVSDLHERFFPAHAAAIRGDTGALRRALLEGGEAAFAPDWLGSGPAHYAAAFGNLAILEALATATTTTATTTTTNDALQSTLNAHGSTPLTLAVERGHSHCADFLAKHGFDDVSTVRFPKVVQSGAGTTNGASMALARAYDVHPNDVAEVQASLRRLATDSSEKDEEEANCRAVAAFGVQLFTDLFQTAPELKPLFPFLDDRGEPKPDALRTHALKVVHAFASLVASLSDLYAAAAALRNLVRSHLKYGVKLHHYHILFSVIAKEVRTLVGDDHWSNEQAGAWRRIFNALGNIIEREYQKVCH